MSSVAAVVPDQVRPWSPGARAGRLAVGSLVLLALVETIYAIVAPLRAPKTQDWLAAASRLRAQFVPGDLIVAAPAWADPIMRMHVGDLLPIPAAARMDDARYGRVWVLSQRGAVAPEEAERTRSLEERFGTLTLRRVERAPAVITYDFLERWQEAQVTVWTPVTRSAAPCRWQQAAFVCPVTGNSVSRTLVEVEQTIRRALLAPPVLGGIVAVEFPTVVLGRELVVAAGLHDTWARKSPGSAHLEVWIAGQPVAGITVDNRSGWRLWRFDTASRDGQTVSVRFQVSSPQPLLRHVAFAAEARR